MHQPSTTERNLLLVIFVLTVALLIALYTAPGWT